MNATQTNPNIVVVEDDDVMVVVPKTTTSAAATTTSSKRRRNKKTSLKEVIQALLPTDLDATTLKRIFHGLHFLLMAHHDYCAAKELLHRSMLFPQIIFHFQQASEKMLKAVLYMLKSHHSNEYNHNLVWIARNFDDLHITVFKRATSSFEHLGQVKAKDKDLRSLAVRCRYPQTNILPLEVFSYTHATKARQLTLLIATQVFAILTIIFKRYGSVNSSSNSNNTNTMTNSSDDEHYTIEYNHERARFWINTQTLLFTLGDIMFTIEFS